MCALSPCSNLPLLFNITNFMFMGCMQSEKWKCILQLPELNTVLLAAVDAIVAEASYRKVCLSHLLNKYPKVSWN